MQNCNEISVFQDMVSVQISNAYFKQSTKAINVCHDKYSFEERYHTSIVVLFDRQQSNLKSVFKYDPSSGGGVDRGSASESLGWRFKPRSVYKCGFFSTKPKGS